jgi:hypothetical protein
MEKEEYKRQVLGMIDNLLRIEKDPIVFAAILTVRKTIERN